MGTGKLPPLNVLDLMGIGLIIMLITIVFSIALSEDVPRPEYYWDCDRLWSSQNAKQKAHEYELACVQEHHPSTCQHMVREKYCKRKLKLPKEENNAKPQ